MIERILVPLDGSEFAEQALEPALRLASRLGASVRLVSAVSNVAPPVGLEADATEGVALWVDEEGKATRRYLEGARDRVTAGRKGIEVTTSVDVGRVTPTILAAAADYGADLILLTTHGRGVWNRLWLGSIADQLLRSSTVPLLLLRGGEHASTLFASDGSPGHAFVPLDGSPAGESALPVLREILPRADRRVTVMSVARELLPLQSFDIADTGWQLAVTEAEKARLQVYLDHVKTTLQGQGFGRVDTLLTQGVDVTRSLLAGIEDSRADLVAVSTQGHGAAERLLTGSVADKIIRGTHLPVLVTRRGERAR